MGHPLDDHDLADLAQDTAVLILEKLEDYEARAPLEGWMFRICTLEMLNGIRKKRRLASRVSHYGESIPHEPHEAVALGEYEHVHIALDRVGGHDADTVRLKHFDGLTFDEIGAKLGISPNTAKTRYYRGMSKLQEILRRRSEESRERAAQ